MGAINFFISLLDAFNNFQSTLQLLTDCPRFDLNGFAVWSHGNNTLSAIPPNPAGLVLVRKQAYSENPCFTEPCPAGTCYYCAGGLQLNHHAQVFCVDATESSWADGVALKTEAFTIASHFGISAQCETNNGNVEAITMRTLPSFLPSFFVESEMSVKNSKGFFFALYALCKTCEPIVLGYRSLVVVHYKHKCVIRFRLEVLGVKTVIETT